MNYKHFLMFAAGFLLQDLKEILNVGIKTVIKRMIKRKPFDHKAPILSQLRDEINHLEKHE